MSVSRRPFVFATVAGVASGTAYLASPLTVWFGLAACALFAWTGRGLPVRERHWMWGLLATGMCLRLLVVAMLFVQSDPLRYASFSWEPDGAYMVRRALWIRNIWLGIPVPLSYYQEAFALYGWTSYLYVLAFIQYLVGPAPFGLHLLNVAASLAGNIAMSRLIRRAYGPAAAVVGFGLVLFLPTLFAWSVSTMKESLYVMLASVGLIALVGVLRAPTIRRRIGAVLVLGAATLMMSTVRSEGLTVQMAGLSLGLAGRTIARRAWLVVLVAVLIVGAGVRIMENPGTQDRLMPFVKDAALRHIGNVRTAGHGFKLLDQRFYSDPNPFVIQQTMTPEEGLRFVIRALAAFVVVPAPWQVESKSELLFLFQQLVWYALLLLVPIGFVHGMRRDALVTCLLAGVTLVGSAVIALNSGNVGTLVRHRDTVVPFVVWFSALGAIAVMSRLDIRVRRS